MKYFSILVLYFSWSGAYAVETLPYQSFDVPPDKYFFQSTEKPTKASEENHLEVVRKKGAAGVIFGAIGAIAGISLAARHCDDMFGTFDNFILCTIEFTAGGYGGAIGGIFLGDKIGNLESDLGLGIRTSLYVPSQINIISGMGIGLFYEMKPSTAHIISPTYDYYSYGMDEHVTLYLKEVGMDYKYLFKLNSLSMNIGMGYGYGTVELKENDTYLYDRSPEHEYSNYNNYRLFAGLHGDGYIYNIGINDYRKREIGSHRMPTVIQLSVAVVF